MKQWIIALLFSASVFAQVSTTNIVALTDSTRLVWDANPEGDIKEYQVESLTGGEVVQKATTNTFMRLIELRPAGFTNGLHRFRVSAVNTAGLRGVPAETSTNLVRPPSIVLNLRLETSGGSATATATATVKN